MKLLIIVVTIFVFPAKGTSQFFLELTTKKLFNGTLTDSVVLDQITQYIGNVDYMIVNALGENTVIDSAKYAAPGNWLPNVSRHFIGSGDINFLFLSNKSDKEIFSGWALMVVGDSMVYRKNNDLFKMSYQTAADSVTQNINIEDLQLSVRHNDTIVITKTVLHSFKKSEDFFVHQVISFAGPERKLLVFLRRIFGVPSLEPP